MSIVDPISHERRQKLLEISPEGRAFSDGHPEEISALVYLPGPKLLAAFLNPRTTCLIDPQTLETVGPTLDNDPFAGATCSASMEQDYLIATKQMKVLETETGIGVWPRQTVRRSARSHWLVTFRRCATRQRHIPSLWLLGMGRFKSATLRRCCQQDQPLANGSVHTVTEY